MPIEDIITQSTPASPSDDRRQSLGVVVVKVPPTSTDYVSVVAIDFDNTQVFQCQWMPRGISFPQLGDEGLMAFDEDGEPWLVAWRSMSGASVGTISAPFAGAITGNGTQKLFTVTHNLGADRVFVEIIKATTREFVQAEVVSIDANQISINMDPAPANLEVFWVTVLSGSGPPIVAPQPTPFEATITGNASQTLWTITHGKGSKRVDVTVRETASPWEFVQAKIKAPTNDSITVEIVPAPANGFQYDITIQGGQSGVSPTAHASTHAEGGSDPYIVPTSPQAKIGCISDMGTWTTGTWMMMQFNRNDLDIGHASSQVDIANDALVCRKAGMYSIVGRLGFGSNETNSRWAILNKNGTSESVGGFATANIRGVSAGGTQVEINAHVRLAVNDLVRIFGYQDSGSTLSMHPGELSWVWLSP